MTDTSRRKPAAFRLDDPNVVVSDDEDVARTRDTIIVRPENESFPLPAVVETTAAPRRRTIWGTLFWSALTGLVSLAVGLSATRLIEDLFARSLELGYLGLGLVTLAALALLIIVGREVFGLARLTRIEKLHQRAAAVLISDDRDEARAIVGDLLRLARENPRLARARSTVEGHLSDIIDGADLIRLAEREILSSLDHDARQLISKSAQRVSLVTAISPRAVIDIVFVLVSAVRLVRQLAFLYGGRPGTLGMIRLFRHVIAHLAVTGGIAVGDGLVQQVLGHGIAAKISSRLGEGVVNGLLTARLGLAAVDVTRPLPFAALPRPALADLMGDLIKRGDSKAK